LIKIELAPVSAKYKVFVRRNMAISVTNSEYSKIELFTTLAPVIIKDNDEKSIYYASSSTEDERKLSNKSNGEIYFNYKVEPKLTTIISEDEKAIFPNGKVKELQQDIYLKLINFNEIIENSDEKAFTSFVRYID
ncbi:hypothetical protein JEP17_00005, partial [Proteus mirabilis]|nr:hypothetical protein [Proteus mirabilis]